MRSAKEIEIRLVKKPDADRMIVLHHYSKRVCQNSQLNFGVFLDGYMIGALQFGPSIDKRRTGPSIGCGMNDYIELNRMAIADVGIKNAESRCISYCLRFIQKNYPFMRAVLSFADACQCGDGTIYRASGFKLVQINKNKSLFALGDEVIAKKKFDNIMLPNGRYLSDYLKGGVISDKTLNDIKTPNGKSMLTEFKKYGFKPLIGYQFKYVYYFDKGLEARQKFISFDQIPDECRMYLSKRAASTESVRPAIQPEGGGENPTAALQSNNIDNT